MELTREVIADMATCREKGCLECRGVCICDTRYEGIETLAKALLVEMDKPSVWTNAPDNAIIAQVHFYKAAKTFATPTAVPEVYTRESPKSREREIAEEHFDKESYIGMCELAILKAKAEWEAGR